MKCVFYFLTSMIIFVHCSNENQENNSTSEVIVNKQELKYKILHIYKHNPDYYCQGFELYNGSLFEGTGLYGKSNIIEYDYQNGKIIQQKNLDKQFFGEGITIFKDKIYQLTWQEHQVFVYDFKLKLLKTLPWKEEGWGLTHNDSFLIVSTGSNIIYFVQPADFKIVKQINIQQNGNAINHINELEYVDGVIYANIYLTDKIIKIDAETGNVLAEADLSNILAEVGITKKPTETDPGFVLNGIAYNKKTNTFLITGKSWEEIFEISWVN